jgi:O-antigen/teichoic acid export membrane protein
MHFENIKQQYKDVAVTFINQAWVLVSGPITMLLITLFLSPEQQGYWYLFGSIAALKIFADLGFSNIILQFSAHEYALLHYTDKGFLAGEELSLEKLGSFLRFVIKWITTISLVVFPMIYIIGILFFLKDGVLALYIVPWTFYAFGTLINFYNASILSFIEGLDRIFYVQKIKLASAILNTFIIVSCLLFRWYIYALALGMLLSSLFMVFVIFRYFKNVLRQLLNISKSFIYNWKKDIVPLFVRYVVSFSSGYFISQIYVPLMHYFHGPSYSGKVGITIVLVSSVYGISSIWLYTIIPKINMFISRKMWRELDVIFKKRLFFSLGTYFFFIIGLYVFVTLFGEFWIIPKVVMRFMPMKSLIILFLAYLINLVLNFWSVYLRGHKQEPYAIPSMISAIWVFFVTCLMGKFMSPDWFFAGFLSYNILFLPFGFAIYKKNKERWHDK